MTLSQTRRNQLIIAGISTVLMVILWSIGDFSREMNFALPLVIVALWIPAALAHKQREGGIVWNAPIVLLGLAVVAVVIRAIWLIGRG